MSFVRPRARGIRRVAGDIVEAARPAIPNACDSRSPRRRPFPNPNSDAVDAQAVAPPRRLVEELSQVGALAGRRSDGAVERVHGYSPYGALTGVGGARGFVSSGGSSAVGVVAARLFAWQDAQHRSKRNGRGRSGEPKISLRQDREDDVERREADVCLEHPSGATQFPVDLRDYSERAASAA